MEAASSESSAIRCRERPRDPRSRVSSSRESLFPGEIRPRHAPLVAEVRRPVASDCSSVIYFGGCCFLEGIKERWRESARRHGPGPQTRGGDGDLSRTRSRGVARAGERAGRASRRFDRSPATRPPSCRPARRIRRKKKPQQRRSPRQPRPRGRRTRRRRSRREGRAPRRRPPPWAPSSSAYSRPTRSPSSARSRTRSAPPPGRPFPPAAIPTLGVYAFLFFGRPASDFGQPPPAGACGGMRARGRNAPGRVSSTGDSARRAKPRAAGPAPSHRARVPPPASRREEKAQRPLFPRFSARANNASSHERFTQTLTESIPPPIVFPRPQLRAMASDVFHPSFPGGRSGSLRDRVGGSFGAQPSSSSAFAGHSCDLREKPGAGDGFPSTEYLQLEGVISSKGVLGGCRGGCRRIDVHGQVVQGSQERAPERVRG